MYLRTALSVPLVVSLLFGSVETQSTPTPLVYAEFQPGGTCDDCLGWRVTILDDGTLTQEVKTAAGWHTPDEWVTRRALHLSRRQLTHLASVIQRVEFGTLRERYDAGYELPNGGERIVTDQDTDILAVATDNRITRVTVYGPEQIAGIAAPEHVHPDRADGKRFCLVWAEVLNLARAPNSWQKAKYYR